MRTSCLFFHVVPFIVCPTPACGCSFNLCLMLALIFPCVLVHLSFCNKTPAEEELLRTGSVCLAVLEAGKPRMRGWSVRPLPAVCAAQPPGLQVLCKGVHPGTPPRPEGPALQAVTVPGGCPFLTVSHSLQSVLLCLSTFSNTNPSPLLLIYFIYLAE